MTWSGYVTGGATLFIQGNRADIQGRDTGAVDRPIARFNEPLPAGRTRVDMQIRRGRGRVEIVEQPSPANEFAAVVQINPPGRRAELYNLEFFWNSNVDTSSDHRDDRWDDRRDDRWDDRRDRRRDNWEMRGRSADMGGGTGQLQWSGEVDNEVLVQVRGQRAASRVVRGQSVTGERIDLSTAMPRQAMNVRLEDVRGRGRIEIVDQPNSQNGFAAIVRVRDEGSGRSPHSFRLVWDGGGINGNDSVLSPSAPSDGRYRTQVPDQGFARWTGRIDGHARITIQGNRATSTTVTGQPVGGMNVDFGGGPGIPSRGLADVQVRKLQGRGEVRVIETPTARNNSALIFEIDDNDGGADNYEVEITWR